MRSMIKSSVFLNLVVLFELFNCQEYEGDSCTLEKSAQPGKCTLLPNCPSVLNELRQFQRLPQTCGFQGTVPIVCCPTSDQPPPVVTPPTIETTPTPTPTPTATPKVPTEKVPEGKYPPISSRQPGEVSRLKCREYGQYVYSKKKPFVTTVVDPQDKELVKYECYHIEKPLIVGGDIAKSGEFPHMALIGYEPTPGTIQWNCGGSLISSQFVLTAGHCVTDRIFGDAKYVRIGIDKRTQNGQLFTVIESYRHKDHQPPIHYNDIGLLKLDKPVKMAPKARPACLFTSTDVNREYGIASGWGMTGFTKKTSDDLREVTLQFKSQQDCNSTYENQIGWKLQDGIRYDTQICAGASEADTLNKDTCPGDSGGPIQIYHPKEDVKCMYDIVGLTSFGEGCGLGKYPGVYTRVSAYIKWIEDIVWP